jgi:FAD/FMN-containing dehydrogenase
VLDSARLRDTLDGELLEPGSPAYDAARRPENSAYADVRPQLVLRSASEADVVRGLAFARATGTSVVPRGGGHCFAGRSSTEGLLLDLSLMSSVDVVDGVARIGAGARLGQVYAELHRAARTLPAGCGETVGIAGLTLGGGIGLLGRRYGLTCDRLVGARVVLADERIVDCDRERELDLFWALRGAGGGQFGVVTSLTFDTVSEPLMTRFELRWGSDSAAGLVAAWQRWAPDAAEELTANLTLAAEPRRDLEVIVFGASMLAEKATRGLLDELRLVATPTSVDVRAGLPYSELKRTFAVLDPREDTETRIRIRSELFAEPLQAATIDALLATVQDRQTGEPRHLTFLALGGAYDRIAADASAFAHRGARFNLEHAGLVSDAWVDRSWEIAHEDGSGGVYANFPDVALPDGPAAYHRANLDRLARIKRAYDPARLFDFPQCIEPDTGAPHVDDVRTAARRHLRRARGSGPDDDGR